MSDLRLVLASALVLGCGGSSPSTAPGPVPAPEPPPATPPEVVTAAPRLCLGETTDVGTHDDERLAEISGLVASRREDGVLWAHNDSGEPVARFFALATDGTLRAEIEVDGAPHHDWEDVAIGTAPDGRELLYFADAGDNGARDGSLPPRASIDVLVVEPPALPPAVAPATLHVGFERLTFTYPDGPHDSEAAFVAPNGDLFLFTKTASGVHVLFRDPAPHAPGTTRVLERVMELLPAVDLGASITAADCDPSGRIAIRTYRAAYLHAPATSGRVEDTLAGVATEATHFHEPQGESIALTDAGVYTISEGELEPLHFRPFIACP